jgi:hypothetical protein
VDGWIRLSSSTDEWGLDRKELEALCQSFRIPQQHSVNSLLQSTSEGLFRSRLFCTTAATRAGLLLLPTSQRGLGTCSEAVLGKDPDLSVGPPTATVFPTNDQKYKNRNFSKNFLKRFKPKPRPKSHIWSKLLNDRNFSRKKKDLNLDIEFLRHLRNECRNFLGEGGNEKVPGCLQASQAVTVCWLVGPFSTGYSPPPTTT